MDRPEVFVVLGGGIVGLCVARRLALAGEPVVVLERGRPGAGASRASAGLLKPPPAPRSPFQRHLAASYRGYERFVREVESECGRRVDFGRIASLHASTSPEGLARLRRQYDRLSQAAETRVEWLDRDELEARFPAVATEVSGALLFPDTARVDPADLLAALRSSLEHHGGRVLQSLGGTEIRPGTRRESGDLRAAVVRFRSADGGLEELLARHIVVCAGAWTTGLLESLGLTPAVAIVPVRGQMAELDPGEDLPCVVHLDDRYLVPRRGGHIWVGATVEDDSGFDGSVTENGIDSLLAAARRIYPGIGRDSIRRTWAGLRPKAMQRGGAVFEVSPVAVLAGHYRSGILGGPRDADRLVERLLGRSLADVSPFELA